MVHGNLTKVIFYLDEIDIYHELVNPVFARTHSNEHEHIVRTNKVICSTDTYTVFSPNIMSAQARLCIEKHHFSNACPQIKTKVKERQRAKEQQNVASYFVST